MARELAAITFLSLDGVMQSPTSPDEDPSGNFKDGGWAADYWEPVMAQVRKEAMAAPYDILFGRKTYELFAGHFPHAPDDDPDAMRMNAAKKYVATNSLESLDWKNSEILSGDIPGAVARLKEGDGPLLQVHGSGELIRALFANGLIDEFRLWTFPVVLGSGKRLFDQGVPSNRLSLVKSAPTGNGVVMTIYRRAEPAT